MDNTWFIQMNGLRLLVDPWLEGTEIDLAGWFNTQWHRTKPMGYDKIPVYDYVLITQKYHDHYHKQTLLKLQPEKLIVPESIAEGVKKLLPNADVTVFSKKMDSVEINGVKIEWLATSRKIDPIYDAYLISDDKEALFLATHGYQLDDEPIKTSKPVKLLISPFDHYQLPFFLGGVVAPGVKGLLHLTEKLSPQYIVATHDEDKHASGLISKVARVTRTTISDLERHEILKNRIIELKDYQAVNL